MIQFTVQIVTELFFSITIQRIARKQITLPVSDICRWKSSRVYAAERQYRYSPREADRRRSPPVSDNRFGSEMYRIVKSREKIIARSIIVRKN